MTRRSATGVVGAFFLLLVDCLAAPFALSSLSPYVIYLFYAPFTLGGEILTFLRQRIHLPLPSWVDAMLLPLNWACYAVLGFFMGRSLYDVFQRKSSRWSSSKGDGGTKKS